MRTGVRAPVIRTGPTGPRVVAACKEALDAAGITIPWPMRTLAADRSPIVLWSDPQDQHPQPAGDAGADGAAG